MNLRRTIVLLSVAGFAVFGGVVACAGGGELNPQPLPPVIGDDDDDKGLPSSSGASTSGYNGSSASSGGVGAGPSVDAGAEPQSDAGDGGDGGPNG